MTYKYPTYDKLFLLENTSKISYFNILNYLEPIQRSVRVEIVLRHFSEKHTQQPSNNINGNTYNKIKLKLIYIL